MFRNYLKIAIRNFARHRLFTVINLLGLAMGMSLGLLIIAIISDLLSYDNFHRNGNSIYRIITKVQREASDADLKATCPFPVADELTDSYQDLGKTTRVQRFFNAKAISNSKVIQVNGYYADTNFLRIFTFPLISGHISDVLRRPNSIVITTRTAKKFFGDREALGETISMGALGDYLVTGILADLPVNSHLQFDVLGSLSSLTQLEKADIRSATLNEWDEFLRNYVYLQLSPGISTNQAETALSRLGQKASEVVSDADITFQMQALKNIIPGPDLSSQIGPKMGYLPLMIMMGVAITILLSACFNYTNLSLARALRRMKEVGVRKAVGGSKSQLLSQFLLETVLLSLLALIIAISIFNLIRPEFLKIVPRAGEMFTLEISTALVCAFMLFAVFTGIIAGLLPATLISGINTVQALKNDTSVKTLGMVNFRKALIVFQFTISLIFLIGIIVIYRQYNFSVNHDPGYATKNIMVVPLYGTDYKVLRNEFSGLQATQSVTGASGLMGGYQTYNCAIRSEAYSDSIRTDYIMAEENFTNDLHIEILAGNSFSSSSKSKEQSAIINKQLALLLGNGKADQAIGKIIEKDSGSFEVIGITEDFHYAHLEEPVRNFMILYQPSAVRYVYVVLAGKPLPDIIQSYKSVWNKINSRQQFEGKMMADMLEETYSFYTNFIKLFGFISFLAISIGCLGLVGMSLYAAESRVKEIGIRKVMGASVFSIVYQLSKKFFLLLAIACCIALPLSYLLFSQLLKNSAYHITIGVAELGLGLIVLLALGMLTVVSQTVRAAIANPVKSLRTE